jgi:sulfide:quinone oxidoreductase
MSAQSPLHARILIVGGGAGGLSVAARLRRSHEQGVVVVEPSDVNYYQPAWSLVGAGIMPVSSTVKPEAQVMPRGVSWVRSAVTQVDPHRREVSLANGDRITYEALVLASGIELHWDGLPGLADAMATDRVSSNYSFDYAEKTWSILRRITSGTVVFSRASGLVKCPSAAQKIMYLAADHWRRKGCLDRIRIVFVTPGERIYDKDEFSDVLDSVAADYGIEVRVRSELQSIDSENQTVTITDLDKDESEVLHYDAAHVVPPQSAPAWIADSGLSDPDVAGGWIKADGSTLQHPDFPEIFSLGDNAGTMNGKTASAVRDQAPVVAANVRAVLGGAQPQARYGGYAGCPITVGEHKVFLTEADYTGNYAPKLPFRTAKPRRSMWLLKRFGLAPLYWYGMLRGRA